METAILIIDELSSRQRRAIVAMKRERELIKAILRTVGKPLRWILELGLR